MIISFIFPNLLIFSPFSLSQIIKVFIASGIFLSYPLNGFVVITVIFSDYKNNTERRKHQTLMEYIVRLAFLILTGGFLFV